MSFKQFFSLTLICAFSFPAAAQADTAVRRPFVIGEIRELFSNELQEKRILNIYLPEGYTVSDTIHYPVIYLLDGSADEDFIHIAGLVQFASFEWVNQVSKSIVVGIATVDRRRDYTLPTTIAEDKMRFPSSGHSPRFLSFIEKELQPFIEKTYKTNRCKTIIGQSLGGLFATQILFEKPALFNKYMIISPSLWWNNGSILQHTLTALKKSNLSETTVYIAVGKEGAAPTATPRIMEEDAQALAKKLQALNQPTLQVHFDYLPNENHATILHQAVMNGFKLLNKNSNAAH